MMERMNLPLADVLFSLTGMAQDLLRADPRTLEQRDHDALAGMPPCADRIAVCATSWNNRERFATLHTTHSMLAQPHRASRVDLDPPRGYRSTPQGWVRCW